MNPSTRHRYTDSVKRQFSHTAMAVLLAITALSCGNRHQHDVPVGIRIFMEDELLAVQDEGVLTYIDRDAIEIPLQATTPTMRVEFISDTGGIYTPDPSEFSLIITIGSPHMISYNQPVGNDPWAFTLRGQQQGQTYAMFEMFHGNHVDFRSQNITIHVVAEDDE